MVLYTCNSRMWEPRWEIMSLRKAWILYDEHLSQGKEKPKKEILLQTIFYVFNLYTVCFSIVCEDFKDRRNLKNRNLKGSLSLRKF